MLNPTIFRPFKDFVDIAMYCRDTQKKLIDDFKNVVQKLKEVNLEALKTLIPSREEVKLVSVEPYEDPLTNFKVSYYAYATPKDEAGLSEDE